MEQKIVEGNKLIAEFMGRKLGYFKWPHGKYHTSWDWLMPVVEKIEEQRGVLEFVIRKTSTFIDKSNSSAIFIDGSDRLRNTWLAVVDFITFYNEQKQ